MTSTGDGGAGRWGDWMGRQQLDHRQIVVSGPLTDEAAGGLSAQLMWLDATGDDRIDLQLDSTGGPLGAGLAVVDTIALLGVAVHAHCRGRVEGSAVAVLAAAERRTCTPHSRFLLCEPSTTTSGTAAQLASWSEQRAADLEAHCRVLAGATGRRLEHVESDVTAGRWLDSATALHHGLVHDVLGPRRP